MKKLLVYVADADALGFIRSILNRPQALGIQPVSYDIERHPQRDAGMVQSGAELTRMKKGKYQKALLLWDHHGSGRDHKQSPEQVAQEIQDKLNSFTWSDNSAVTVLVPELEQWLWYAENALAKHCDVTLNELQQWTQARAAKLNSTVEQLKERQPTRVRHFLA